MPDFRAYPIPSNSQGKSHYVWFVDVEGPTRIFKALPVVYVAYPTALKNRIRRSFALKLGLGGLDEDNPPTISMRFSGSQNGNHKTEFFPLEVEIVSDETMNLFGLKNKQTNLILCKHPEFPNNEQPISYDAQEDFFEIVFTHVPCAV